MMINLEDQLTLSKYRRYNPIGQIKKFDYLL
jgi:hypothetical protein